MLESLVFEDRRFDLGRSECSTNKFSIIVGKNGTGKSRLLSSIVRHFAAPPRDAVSNRERFAFDPISEVKYQTAPNSVIAVSTSPFDKFPVWRDESSASRYSYLGLRGLPSMNLGLTFMSRIIGRLVDAILQDSRRANVIGSTLEDLGYLPHLKARFLLQIGRDDLQAFFESEDKVGFLLENPRFGRPRAVYPGAGYWVGSTARPKADYESVHKAEELAFALQQMLEFNFPSRQDILLDSNGIYELRNGIPIGSEHVTLMEAGLLRLKDVELQKVDGTSPFRINDASSGEQCVVMTLVGIASRITDNSLICIDEPEICLHPEWQERYMERLISTFSEFSECHFIIATHSPQIVANLENRQCFVVDMESGGATPAESFYRRSADFQLANVFKSPGYKNEYLSRELIGTLAVLSSTLNPDEKVLKKAQELVNFKPKLHESDPLNKLVDMLVAALAEARS
ncbi:TPA: ATP-binding protein [Burkholderia vietnamiensis]|nr:ATP-binding protein [Burkholderia vietnamiensis]